MSNQFNFQFENEWYTGGVTDGAIWAKHQKKKNSFLDEAGLTAAAPAIKAALEKRATRSVTRDSAIAKELGALALSVLGDSAEG
jgi:hypothetical protein